MANTRRAVIWGLWASLLWPVTAAQAYEDQATLSLGLGYAHAVSDAAPPHGALLDVSASLGLNDVYTLRGRGSYAYHPHGEPLHVFIGGAEILYLIDIFELVPYFGVGADFLGAARSGTIGGDLGLHTVIGLDYLVSRELALGFDFRSIFLVTALDEDPVYLAAGLSVILMFDL